MAARLVNAITAAARSAKDATSVVASGRSIDRPTVGQCDCVASAAAIPTAANVPVASAPPEPADASSFSSESRAARALAASFRAPFRGSEPLGPHCTFVEGVAGAGTAETSSRRADRKVARPDISPVPSKDRATPAGGVVSAGDAVAAVILAVCGGSDDAPLDVVSDGGGLHAGNMERDAASCRDDEVECRELSFLCT